MANTIIKGKVQDYERFEKYDDEGIKYIAYWIRVNGKKYTLSFPEKPNFYFENQLEVVLLVNEKNEAIAGLCPKGSFTWGNAKSLKSEVKESDRFELVQGLVIEKRKEAFRVNQGTTTSSYDQNSKTVVTYTIVLPDKTFRVVEHIGKKIKPNTEIAALLEEGSAYIVQDKTNNKIYGKPRKDYIIAIVLWLAFNITMMYFADAVKEKTMTLVIGNIFFGLAFLFSFTAFLSSTKTLKIFYELTGEEK